MNLYTCILLVPKTGNRIVIESISAEVNIINDFYTVMEPSGYKRKVSKGPTALEIILETITTSKEQYEKMTKLIVNEKLYLHFKDTHPNLISGYIRSIAVDQHKTTIIFDGNTIDKTYNDYVTDVSTKLKETFNWQEEPELPEPDLGFKKKVHFRKEKEEAIQVLKRKLTF